MVLVEDVTLTDSGSYETGIYISSGGTLSNATITGTSFAHIENMGTEVDTKLYQGFEEVYSGASIDTVISGGSVYVERGGLISGATLLADGPFNGITIYDGGRSVNDVIEGGVETLANGEQSGAVVSSGGTVVIVASLPVQVGSVVSYSITITDLTVLSGGVVSVGSGAYISDSVVSSGGILETGLYIVSGQTVTAPLAGVTSPFAGLTLESGAVVILTSTTVESGAVLDITAPANGLGPIDVRRGGVLTGDLVSADIEYIEGQVSAATIGWPQIRLTTSGALATDITLVDQGHLTVGSGGFASGVLVSGAGAEIGLGSGGGVIGAVVEEGVLNIDNSVASGTVVGGLGSVDTFSGGLADGLTVRSGGEFTLASGGMASGLTVQSGGMATIMLGGEVSGLEVQAGATLDMRMSQGILSASVADGQFVLLNDGATANAISLTPGGADFHLALSDDGQNGVLVNVTNKSRDDFDGSWTSELLVQDQASGAVYAIGQSLSGEQNLGGLGSEWSFRGTGDYLGHARTDYLIQNSAGALVVGELNDGQMDFATVGGLGSGWSFQGTGDFLGDRQDQVLLQNANGAVVLGEATGGQMAYSDITALGADWHFRGTGDFLGDGRTGFLLQNDAGLLVTGKVAGGQVTYSTIGAIGGEWAIKETGDFLGDGKDDFLMQNSAGALAVAEVTGGQASYAAVGALGSEWTFVGALDGATGAAASFLIQNTAGAVVKGTVVDGQAQYASYGALGSNWSFHG